MVNYFEVRCEVMEDFYVGINDETLKKLGFKIPQIVGKIKYKCENEGELYKLIAYTMIG